MRFRFPSTGNPIPMPMFRNLRLVYVTTKDKQQARTIARALVEERLAACANILDGMESVYHWKGEVVEDTECVLILKTPYHNLPRINRRIKELHSYEVPCVITFTMTEQEGNEAYLDWLLAEAPHSDSDIRGNDLRGDDHG